MTKKDTPLELAKYWAKRNESSLTVEEYESLLSLSYGLITKAIGDTSKLKLLSIGLTPGTDTDFKDEHKAYESYWEDRGLIIKVLVGEGNLQERKGAVTVMGVKRGRFKFWKFDVEQRSFWKKDQLTSTTTFIKKGYSIDAKVVKRALELNKPIDELLPGVELGRMLSGNPSLITVFGSKIYDENEKTTLESLVPGFSGNLQDLIETASSVNA